MREKDRIPKHGCGQAPSQPANPANHDLSTIGPPHNLQPKHGCGQVPSQPANATSPRPVHSRAPARKAANPYAGTASRINPCRIAVIKACARLFAPNLSYNRAT